MYARVCSRVCVCSSTFEIVILGNPSNPQSPHDEVWGVSSLLHVPESPSPHPRFPKVPQPRLPNPTPNYQSLPVSHSSAPSSTRPTGGHPCTNRPSLPPGWSHTTKSTLLPSTSGLSCGRRTTDPDVVVPTSTCRPS